MHGRGYARLDVRAPRQVRRDLLPVLRVLLHHGEPQLLVLYRVHERDVDKHRTRACGSTRARAHGCSSSMQQRGTQHQGGTAQALGHARAQARESARAGARTHPHTRTRIYTARAANTSSSVHRCRSLPSFPSGSLVASISPSASSPPLPSPVAMARHIPSPAAGIRIDAIQAASRARARAARRAHARCRARRRMKIQLSEHRTARARDSAAPHVRSARSRTTDLRPEQGPRSGAGPRASAGPAPRLNARARPTATGVRSEPKLLRRNRRTERLAAAAEGLSARASRRGQNVGDRGAGYGAANHRGGCGCVGSAAQRARDRRCAHGACGGADRRGMC